MNDLLDFATKSQGQTFGQQNATNLVDVAETSLELLRNEIGFIFNPEFETLVYEDVEAAGNSDENFILPDLEPTSLSNLPPYIAALYSIPLLTAAGETALFRQMNFLKYWANAFRSALDPKRPSREMNDEIQILLAEAERTRNQIIESNLRLVVSIARKFSKDLTSFEDLVSEGNAILVKAIEKFDYSRGFRFSTYVTHSVQRHFYRHFQRIHRRNKKELSISENTLTEQPGPAFDDDAALDSAAVDKLISRMGEFLDDREQFIVRERFGFGKDACTRTFQSLSDDLGVCKERVRQLFNIAIGKLRDLAIDLDLDAVAA